MYQAKQDNVEELQFEIYEKLNEIISEADSIYSASKIGLDYILQIFDRQSGAIYIPTGNKKRDPIWIVSNPPEQWIDSFGYPDGRLLTEIKNIIENNLTHGISSSCENTFLFPIHMKGSVRAVLVIDETEIDLEKRANLFNISRIIGRVIVFYQTQTAAISREQYLTTLRIISAAQSTELNMNDVQFWIMKGIKDTFEGELAGLILIDPENPNIASKKLLGDGTDWSLNNTIRFDKGLLKTCVETGLLYQTTDVLNHPKFESEIDSFPNITSRSIICSPLIVNSKAIGVIAIHNSPYTPLDIFDQGLLVSLTTSLANSIFNNQLIQQLKIANADLEASGWELLNSRNTLRALFDSIPASFYIIDRNYSLVAINRSRATRAGVAPNILVGKRCYEALYQLSDPCPSCQVRNTLFQGQLTSRSHRYWGSNESATEWEISTYPILDKSNLSIQAILLEQDVTEKRRLESELIQSEKLAAVGQLAAGVAHEINNPLSAVIANAQILLKDLPSDQFDLIESVQLIETAGLRAGHVVKNLLGLARKEVYEFLPIDLNESIQNALTLLSHELLIRPIKIRFDRGENLPKLVGSKDHLQSVWINIVMNAIEAIDVNVGEITITTRMKDDEFIITIRDDGPGIPSVQVGKIFEPFFTTKSPVRGTGLGLSVVHRIIKSHGGRVLVESEVGRGTLFSIILPENKQY